MDKNAIFRFRLSQADKEKLEKAAGNLGLSASSLVRLIIRNWLGRPTELVARNTSSEEGDQDGR